MTRFASADGNINAFFLLYFFRSSAAGSFHHHYYKEAQALECKFYSEASIVIFRSSTNRLFFLLSSKILSVDRTKKKRRDDRKRNFLMRHHNELSLLPPSLSPLSLLFSSLSLSSIFACDTLSVLLFFLYLVQSRTCKRFLSLLCVSLSTILGNIRLFACSRARAHIHAYNRPPAHEQMKKILFFFFAKRKGEEKIERKREQLGC